MPPTLDSLLQGNQAKASIGQEKGCLVLEHRNSKQKIRHHHRCFSVCFTGVRVKIVAHAGTMDSLTSSLFALCAPRLGPPVHSRVLLI